MTAHARAVREQKVRNDMSAAKKETKFYLQKVEQSRSIRAMEQRKARAAGGDDSMDHTSTNTSASRSNDTATSRGDGQAVAGAAAAVTGVKRPAPVMRSFKQRMRLILHWLSGCSS